MTSERSNIYRHKISDTVTTPEESYNLHNQHLYQCERNVIKLSGFIVIPTKEESRNLNN